MKNSLHGALILDGKAEADILCEGLALRVKTELTFKPCLAVVIVGDDPASQIYVGRKIDRAQSIGFESQKYELSPAVSEEELLGLIEKLNDDDNVDGILVQFPLPPQLSQQKIIEAIHPDKDVDGFHPHNQVLKPCTPLGCMILIQSVQEKLRGLKAVVIGRSHHVGKPMAEMLREAGCEVQVVHSKTENPQEVCRNADILVAAVGKPHLVKGDWIKPGAIVIDVGINRLEDGRIVGDVDFEAARARASAITPVPGGVGPMTVACLMENTLKAAIARRIKTHI